MIPFIKVPNGNGDSVLIPVAKISYVEQIGPNHKLREGYDAMSEQNEDVSVESVIYCVDGEKEYSVPCKWTAGMVELKIKGACR